ncbi:hypothetical protein [uncultured Bacteroides sp.]|uniref:hypothetical protein n=1 Tax=uncultured Bacteroides sp. TaxID=162156 RepID=UPI002AAC0237|nr:hypothetical protein [uncultured Bacteroides sp.]
MEGELFIDGKDAYTTYGIGIINAGYKGIASYPSLKEPDTNDWPDENGIEADLSEPALDKRDISINFYGVSEIGAASMISDLSSGAYHIWYFAEIGCTMKLRISKESSKKIVKSLQTFTLKFIDDFPFYGFTMPDDETKPIIPQWGVSQTGYNIDDISLADYGIYVIDGADENIMETPEAKTNLEISIKNKNGITYDASFIKYKSKDCTIPLFIRSSSKEDFWNRYYTLLYNLTRPEARRFLFSRTNTEYSFYYKSGSCSRIEILSDGGIWCEFSIVLVFMDYTTKEFYAPIKLLQDGNIKLLLNGTIHKFNTNI